VKSVYYFVILFIIRPISSVRNRSDFHVLRTHVVLENNDFLATMHNVIVHKTFIQNSFTIYLPFLRNSYLKVLAMHLQNLQKLGEIYELITKKTNASLVTLIVVKSSATLAILMSFH